MKALGKLRAFSLDGNAEAAFSEARYALPASFLTSPPPNALRSNGFTFPTNKRIIICNIEPSNGQTWR